MLKQFVCVGLGSWSILHHYCDLRLPLFWDTVFFWFKDCIKIKWTNCLCPLSNYIHTTDDYQKTAYSFWIFRITPYCYNVAFSDEDTSDRLVFWFLGAFYDMFDMHSENATQLEFLWKFATHSLLPVYRIESASGNKRQTRAVLQNLHRGDKEVSPGSNVTAVWKDRSKAGSKFLHSA